MKKTFEKISYIYDHLEESLIAVALIALVVLNFVNVVCRKFLPDISFSSTEAISIILFAWVSFLGIGVGYRRYSHSRVTFLIEKLPIFLRKILIIFQACISLLFLGIAFKTGVDTVKTQVEFHQLVSGLTIPAVYAGLSIPVGMVLIAVRVVTSSITEFKSIGKKKEEI